MENNEKDLKDQMKNQKVSSKEISMSRRKFLKKTGYAAPSLIILGNLPKPVMALEGSVDSTNTSFDDGFGGGNSFVGG